MDDEPKKPWWQIPPREPLKPTYVKLTPPAWVKDPPRKDRQTKDLFCEDNEA